MGAFKGTDRKEQLLELLSNQIQLSNIQQVGNANTPSQTSALRTKIINQRAELEITVEGF